MTRPQVTAQVATLSAQLASNLKGAGMTNAVVDSLSSTVLSTGAPPPPAVTDAAAAAAGVLGGLLLGFVAVLALRRPIPDDDAAEAAPLPAPLAEQVKDNSGPELEARPPRNQGQFSGLDYDCNPSPVELKRWTRIPLTPGQPYSLSAELITWPS